MRRALRLLCLALLVLALCVAAVFAALQTAPVRSMLLNTLAAKLTASTGWRLEAEKTGGMWPFDIRLDGVRLSDTQGVWFSADEARVRLVPSPFEVNAATVEGTLRKARMVRAPVMPPASAPSKPGSPLAFLDRLKTLPVRAGARIAIDELSLEEPVLGRTMRLTLHAQALSAPDEMTLGAKAGILDDPSTSVTLAAGFAPARRVLSLDANLEEAAGGLVSGLVRLGSAAPLAAKLSGTGPLGSWQGRLTAAQNADTLLTANVTADLDPAQPLSVALDLAVPRVAQVLAPFVTPEREKLAAVLGAEAAFTASVHLDPERVLTISQATLEAKSLTLKASGTYALTARDADIASELAVGDLSSLSAALGHSLAGELTLTSNIKGPVTAPSVAAKLTGSRVAIDATRFDTVTAEINATHQVDGASQGTLAAGVTRAGQSLSANTRFSLASDRLALSGLTVAGPGVQASGNMDVGLAPVTATGRLTARADLARLGTFLQRPLAGAAELSADLSATGARQDAALSLSASGVKAFGVVVNRAQAQGRAIDVTRAPAGTFGASVTGAKLGASSLDTLQLKATGNGKDASLTLTGKGKLREPFTVDASAVFTAASPNGGGGRVRLDRLQATLAGVKIASTRAATLAFGQGALTLTDFAMTAGSGKLTAQGAMKPGQVALSANLADLPLELLEKFHVVRDLSGTLAATLNVSGEPGNPKVDATLMLSKVREGGLAGKSVPSATVTATAQYAQNKAAAHGLVTAGEGVSLEARAAVPAHLSLMPFAAAVPANAALDAHLAGSADLAKLAAFSGQDGLRMAGTLTADLSAAGRLDAPELSGRASLSNAEMEYADTGTLLKNITLDADAQGRTITIQKFSASDGQTGTLLAHGTAGLPLGGPFALDMRVVLDKAALMRTDMVNAVLSGTVAVSGSASGIAATGKLSTGPVQINIPQRIPPNVTPVAFTMVNDPNNPPTAAKQTPAALPISLDIGIDFPGRIFVRGYGLDSVWDGQLHITGQAASPDVTGEINAVRGRLDFFGKPLTLAKGVVSFTGGQPINPRLDVDARYQGADISSGILVTGDVKHLNISLTSDPMLPQDEILAHMLFGKSASSLTLPQALQLAQAAAALSGKGDAVDIMGKTRKLAGLDYLGIGSESGGKKPDTGQMAITAGKYISDKVYVETSQGFGGDGPSVSVQVDVFPHVTIESTTGVNAKTGASVNWKLDY